MTGGLDVNPLLPVSFKSEIDGLRSLRTDLRLQILGLDEESALGVEPEGSLFGGWGGSFAIRTLSFCGSGGGLEV